MTNEEAIKALKEMKTYTAPALLDELDYVIAVMEKLNKETDIQGVFIDAPTNM